jgi:hypothetical protein
MEGLKLPAFLTISLIIMVALFLLMEFAQLLYPEFIDADQGLLTADGFAALVAET